MRALTGDRRRKNSSWRQVQNWRSGCLRVRVVPLITVGNFHTGYFLNYDETVFLGVGFLYRFFPESSWILIWVYTCFSFCIWSYRYLNLNHVLQRALSLLSNSHTCFFDTIKKLQTPLPDRCFSCAYEVTQTPYENNMSGANTRTVFG